MCRLLLPSRPGLLVASVSSPLLFAAAALAAPPANDHCHNATVITGTDYMGSVIVDEATTQSCEASAGPCDAASTW